ncbi:dITPase [Marininema mesophilum]|uniref:DITPase n=1 Tax=Marininema mesophilum TaxID=1048340 RepID=A0A1H2TQJ8_9BACL|nr:non-canonical purine NTP pyrophosphatase [Marininema mesophilum]SDW45564.1 dITPase [Marininema mesophilum]
MILPFATTNDDKLKEAERVLKPHGIEVTPLRLTLMEPDTGSIEAVAWEKLKQVCELGYERVMVDDAGIFFAAYPHFPGILTKRVFDRIGYKGILKLLEGESRQAWFEGAMGVIWDGERAVFSAKTPGRLLGKVPQNMPDEPGFPFNRIFVPDGETRTFAQMSLEEREAYSYRGQVLHRIASWLINQGI